MDIPQDTSNRVDTNIVVAYLLESSVLVYDSNGNMVFDGPMANELNTPTIAPVVPMIS